MANTFEQKSVSGGCARLTDSISLGVLADVLPRDLIEDVLDETGRRERKYSELV